MPMTIYTRVGIRIRLKLCGYQRIGIRNTLHPTHMIKIKKPTIDSISGLCTSTSRRSRQSKIKPANRSAFIWGKLLAQL